MGCQSLERWHPRGAGPGRMRPSGAKTTRLEAPTPAAAQLGCTSGPLRYSWGARAPGGTPGLCSRALACLVLAS